MHLLYLYCLIIIISVEFETTDAAVATAQVLRRKERCHEIQMPVTKKILCHITSFVVNSILTRLIIVKMNNQFRCLKIDCFVYKAKRLAPG